MLQIQYLCRPDVASCHGQAGQSSIAADVLLLNNATTTCRSMCNARTKTTAPATSGPACNVYAIEHESGVGSYVSVGAGQLAESIRLVYLVHFIHCCQTYHIFCFSLCLLDSLDLSLCLISQASWHLNGANVAH